MSLHYHGGLAVHRVTLIPGDGVGPEVSEATRLVLEATGVQFEWDVQNAGLGVMDQYGTPMPEHVLESIRRNKVAIKGPLTTPIGKGIRSVNVALRKELDLYALVRPCKSYPGVRSRYDNIDLIIERADRQLCLHLRPQPRTAEGDGRAQGQHHEVHRRPLPAGSPGNRQRASGHPVQ